MVIPKVGNGDKTPQKPSDVKKGKLESHSVTPQKEGGIGNLRIPRDKFFDPNRTPDFKAEVPTNEWRETHPDAVKEMDKTVQWIGG